MSDRGEKSFLRGLGLGLGLALATPVFAATKCSIREGSSCAGPVVYEIQLCRGGSFDIHECNDLCRNLRPICSVAPGSPDYSFDPWVRADAKKGVHGPKGPLAENVDDYDELGNLAYTSEKNYTVCIEYKDEKAVLLNPLLALKKGYGKFTDPAPVNSQACPRALVASASSCASGTVFNPATRSCEIRDAACGSSGSGTFAGVVTQGRYLVGVQNEHFAVTPGQDPNLKSSAAIAGSTLPGISDPTAAPAADAAIGAPTFGAVPPPATNFGSTSRVAPTPTSGSVSLGAAGGADPASGKEAAGADSGFAAKDFAMANSAYKGSAAFGVGTGGAGATGASGFETGGAAATAGGASGEIAVDGADGTGAGGAGRGLASDGRLSVEDPANYFLLSDVDTSLFKRVTAQCRKKERSLVLGAAEASAARAAVRKKSAN